MKQFDLISDTHIDFWVYLHSNQFKMEKNLREFTKRLLPEEPSDVLVIAGDLGHYNKQNIMFLNILKETYKTILLVDGNHDLYMVSRNMQYKFNRNSTNRINEMKEMASKIDGVFYLDGTIVEADGIKFGGTGMWYDLSYGMNVMNLSMTKILDTWKERMNDSTYIMGEDNKTFTRFWSELEKLEKVLDDSEVIVTHVGPDWSKVPQKYQDDICTSFYYFNGEKYLENLSGKVWCFGHTHERYSYDNNGCWMVNASLGYPGESSNNRKIVNIPLY